MKGLYNHLQNMPLAKEAYKYVLQNNPGNFNVYHNLFHLENVTNTAINGAIFHNLESIEIENIAIAALFHDFNHSGGEKSDDENIQLAINGLHNFIKGFEYVGLNFDVKRLNRIVNLIKITRYSYENQCKDLTIQEQILRDSDVLQGLFCENYVHGVVLSIAKESKIDLVTALKKQEAFLNNFEFCTEWAKFIQGSRLYQVLEEVNSALALFTL